MFSKVLIERAKTDVKEAKNRWKWIQVCLLDVLTVFTGSFECKNYAKQDLLRDQADTSLSPTRGLLDLSALVRAFYFLFCIWHCI